MKILSLHRLLFRLVIGIALIVLVSAAWNPYILEGKELGYTRGACCQRGKKPDTGALECSDDCSGTTYDRCKTGSSSDGCYCILIGNKCGKTEDEEPCGGNGCGSCTP